MWRSLLIVMATLNRNTSAKWRHLRMFGPKQEIAKPVKNAEELFKLMEKLWQKAGGKRWMFITFKNEEEKTVTAKVISQPELGGQRLTFGAKTGGRDIKFEWEQREGVPPTVSFPPQMAPVQIPCWRPDAKFPQLKAFLEEGEENAEARNSARVGPEAQSGMEDGVTAGYKRQPGIADEDADSEVFVLYQQMKHDWKTMSGNDQMFISFKNQEGQMVKAKVMSEASMPEKLLSFRALIDEFECRLQWSIGSDSPKFVFRSTQVARRPEFSADARDPELTVFVQYADDNERDDGWSMMEKEKVHVGEEIDDGEGESAHLMGYVPR